MYKILTTQKRNRLVLLLLLVTVTVQSQLSVNIGFDPKIGLIGSDNQYTKHGRINNFHIKVEQLEQYNNYIALGIEYANLSEWYFAYYATGGKAFNLNDNETFKVLTTFEIGFIIRQLIKYDEFDRRGNPSYPYCGFNGALRYSVNDLLTIEMQEKVSLATDLPHRKLRYAGFVSIIINIIK